MENFLSFGGKQSISFEATSDKKYLDELTVKVKPGVRLLKVAMIYGANASGKTNLLNAMQALWRMLFYSRPTKDKPTNAYSPFALRKGQPTIFDIVFYMNGEQYDYHIEYDNDNVLKEEMFYRPNGVRALFYTRDFNGIKFGETLGLRKETETQLKINTLNNHSVLSTFGKTNIEESGTEIEKLYDWIKCNIHEIGIHNNLMDIVEEAEKDVRLKDFMLNALTVSDFNINDFRVVELPQKQAFIDSINEDDSISVAIKEMLIQSDIKEIEFTHHTVNGDFNLNAHLESKGTRSSFSLIRKFYDLICNTCIHMIDEIGEGLHPDLVRHNLVRFIRNSGESQLIFTTHNQLLLDEDFVRRDMVWITEKSPKTAETELVPVASYRLHSNKSLFNSYNIGQLGGKPALGSTLIEDKED